MKRKTAFTFVEFVVVFGIISLLLAIAVPIFIEANRTQKIYTKGKYEVLTIKKENQKADFPRQVVFEEYPHLFWDAPQGWRSFLSNLDNVTTLPCRVLIQKEKLLVVIDGRLEQRQVQVFVPNKTSMLSERRE